MEDDDPQSFGNMLAKKARGRGLTVRTREVDYLKCRCGATSGKEPCDLATLRQTGRRCYNLLRDEVFEELLAEARSGMFRVCVAGFPCNTYSVARFRDTMDGRTPPLRDRDHKFGLPNLTAWAKGHLAKGNQLTRRSLLLCAAVWAGGGEVLIENPPDYAKPGLWSRHYSSGSRQEERHCPLWELPWVVEFLEATGSELLHFAQCAHGSDFQKYSTLACSPRWRRVAKESFDAFDQVPCTCERAHRDVASGWNANGSYHSKAAAAYPLGMKAYIVQAVISLLESQRPHQPLNSNLARALGMVQPPVVPPPDTQARVQRLESLHRNLTSAEAMAVCEVCDAGEDPAHPSAAAPGAKRRREATTVRAAERKLGRGQSTITAMFQLSSAGRARGPPIARA